MSQQVTISASSLKKLADLLEEAGRVARELSKGKKSDFAPIIPKLRRPDNVPADQAWFWSEKWQAGEKEVNKDLKTGQYDEFNNMEELIADLHRQI